MVNADRTKGKHDQKVLAWCRFGILTTLFNCYIQTRRNPATDTTLLLREPTTKSNSSMDMLSNGRQEIRSVASPLSRARNEGAPKKPSEPSVFRSGCRQLVLLLFQCAWSVSTYRAALFCIAFFFLANFSIQPPEVP